jgi:hypothetical protein
VPQPLQGVVIRGYGSDWWRLEVLTHDGKPLIGVSALRIEWNASERRYEAHLTVLDPTIDIPLAPHQVRIAVHDADGKPLAPPRPAEGLMTTEPTKE